jgi:hypothetical protein
VQPPAALDIDEDELIQELCDIGRRTMGLRPPRQQTDTSRKQTTNGWRWAYANRLRLWGEPPRPLVIRDVRGVFSAVVDLRDRPL